MAKRQMQMRPQWAREKQPDPPDFGKAKRIPRWLLNFMVWRRRLKTKGIILKSDSVCNFEKGLVSLVVLSCKRFAEFRRLCKSMKTFFNQIENYTGIEKILADNGSGLELVNYAKGLNLFDIIIAHPVNLGMAGALNDAYQRCRGEYIMLIEDDMVMEYDKPFVQRCMDIFTEFPEIGIIRLKNQNNWWKPFRIIGPLRSTSTGVEFWTWLPSFNGQNNVWACGSVLFRKVSFFSTGLLPSGQGRNQAYVVENLYGKGYNKTWLAAKVKNCYPVVQPNDNPESPGFEDKLI